MSRLPSAVSAASLKVDAKKRPRARPLMLPNYVFSSAEGKSRKQIRKLARKEAKDILKMRKDRIGVSEEVRRFAIAVSPAEVAEHLATVQEENASRPSGEDGASSSKLANSPNKDAETASESKPKIATKPVAAAADSGEAKTLIKHGKFGPDEGKFCMELPNYYPKMAGQAKGALDEHLTRYEKLRVKAERDRIRTAAELREQESSKKNKKLMPGWMQRMVMYAQTEEAMLAATLEADYALHTLTESAYVARRRLEMHQLPGMLPHYPDKDIATNRSASLQELYSNAQEKKKPLSVSIFAGYRTKLMAKELAMRGPVGRGKEAYKPPGIANQDGRSGMDLILEAAQNAPSEDTEMRKVPQRRRSSAGNYPTGRRKSSTTATAAAPLISAAVAVSFDDTSLDQSLDNSLGKVSLDGEDSKKPKKRNKGKKSIAIDTSMDELMVPGNGFTKGRKGFPDGVYMERRFSFPQAPGLESLSMTDVRGTQLDIMAEHAFARPQRGGGDTGQAMTLSDGEGKFENGCR